MGTVAGHGVQDSQGHFGLKKKSQKGYRKAPVLLKRSREPAVRVRVGKSNHGLPKKLPECKPLRRRSFKYCAGGVLGLDL